MPKSKPKSAPDPGGYKMVSFRLPVRTIALIEALAASYTDDPDMPATKTGVVVIAVRELAERRLKGRKK